MFRAINALPAAVIALFCMLMISCTARHAGPGGSLYALSAREAYLPVNAYEEPDPAAHGAAESAAALELTVGDAILMALRNNRALEVQRITPAIRETFEEQEIARFDRSVGGDLSAQRERSPAGENGEGVTSGRVRAGIDITEFFPAGTDISLGLSSSRDWSDLYSDRHSARLGLTVTQSLLRGAGADINLASVRQAGLDTLSSRYELRAFAEHMVAAVETTYWNYALARSQIEIYRQSLDLAEQQLAETRARISVGRLAETELAAAQAEAALRREALITANSSLDETRLRFLRLLNLPADSRRTREIVLKNIPGVPEAELDDVESHLAVAFKMRPDINQAVLVMERGDLEVVKTKNGLLPRMDLFIALGKTGYADSFGRAVEDIGGRGYDIAAGLSLDLPLGRREASAAHSRAVLLRRQAEAALENLAQLAEFDVRTAYIRVNRFSEQIAATAATRVFQEEKLRMETEKFRVGQSTSLLVAQAQRDLLDSRISEIQAVVNYLNSIVELFLLEGSLLERRGISAEGVN